MLPICLFGVCFRVEVVAPQGCVFVVACFGFYVGLCFYLFLMCNVVVVLIITVCFMWVLYALIAQRFCFGCVVV